jgi:hypothetical protein
VNLILAPRGTRLEKILWLSWVGRPPKTLLDDVESKGGDDIK